MLETNARIVYPGKNVQIAVRRAIVEGTDISADLLDAACSKLRNSHGLAAVPLASDNPSLLVATRRPLPQPLHLEAEEWELDVYDAKAKTSFLSLDDAQGRELLPLLVERAFLADLARYTDLWTLDSPRIWYEPQPFLRADGVAAYRRYEIGTVLLEGVGIAIVADIGTAFFTEDTLAYFFDPTCITVERERRNQQFTKLTGRQEGQKGTLLYDTTRRQSRCYFEQAPRGVTCATTGKIRAKGKSYSSLADYYREKDPELGNYDTKIAVKVSFPGLDRPQWVAADLVKVRVMNEHLPRALSQADKIAPASRRAQLAAFWNRIQPRALGRIGLRVENRFWYPDPSQVTHCAPVQLVYGNGVSLPPPADCTVEAYQRHFRQRFEYLNRYGVYALPAASSQGLYCAYPEALGEGMVRRLANGLATRINQWAVRQIAVQPVAYATVSEGIEQLQRANRSVVLFILNEEPSAYYEAAYQLEGWRIKRITEPVLQEKHQELLVGSWDRRGGERSLEKGKRSWEQFITMNALDLIQQMDGVPWRIPGIGPYECLLTIDVGHDRRFFALSLLVARAAERLPDFCLITRVQGKLEHNQETINAVVLEDEIVKLFQEMPDHQLTPLASVLVLRDGRTVGQEREGIDKAMHRLRELGYVTTSAPVDVVDLHKDSGTPMRIWEVDVRDRVTNPLEGTVLQLSEHMAVVTPTGEATLHQGTADPLLLIGQRGGRNIRAAAEAVCAGAQLNWSSPQVAQRLPLPLKRTDEELSARAAQEIRRLR